MCAAALFQGGTAMSIILIAILFRFTSFELRLWGKGLRDCEFGLETPPDLNRLVCPA